MKQTKIKPIPPVLKAIHEVRHELNDVRTAIWALFIANLGLACVLVVILVKLGTDV